MSSRDLNSNPHILARQALLTIELCHQLFSACVSDFPFGDSVGDVKALIPQVWHGGLLRQGVSQSSQRTNHVHLKWHCPTVSCSTRVPCSGVRVMSKTHFLSSSGKSVTFTQGYTRSIRCYNQIGNHAVYPTMFPRTAVNASNKRDFFF